MATPLNKKTILSIFGARAGQKLLNFLDPCCTTNPCCAEERYALSAAYDSCSDGADRYLVTIIPSFSLEGYSVINLYLNTGTGFNDTGNPIITAELVAGQTYTYQLLNVAPDTAVSFFAIDSRGNWSNTVALTTEPCP